MDDNQAIRFPREGNPYFPLPPDYHELSDEGQRLARVNACCLRETPDDLVQSWNFFRRTYLMRTLPGFFYGEDLAESPQFHYDLVRDLGAYAYNAYACPRGFGKSTLIDEMVLLMSLTVPRYPISLCLASDALLQERFEIYQRQFGQNEYILNDFGNQRPSRGSGEGSWNLHVLALRNGSRIKGFPVEGRKRGTKPRPRLLFLDDPEYDPKKSTDTSQLREEFEWLLTRVLLPMGEQGMSMAWIGTIITKQSALWHFCVDDDPQTRRWNRVVLAAEMPDEAGDYQPLWPELWGQDALDARRADLGAGGYAAEMLNNPGHGEGATFQIDDQRHGYSIEGDTGDHPLTSMARVKYHVANPDGEWSPVTKEWGPFVSAMYRMLLVDYAPTVSRHSDYSAVAVVGFERPADILWVLDVFAGKVKQPALLRKVWELGNRWRVAVVGVESVSVQNDLFDSTAAFVSELGESQGWVPRVMPIKYPYGVTKQDRIGGMQWRFTSNRIKLPLHSRDRHPFSMLWQQLREFRAEARDGGLMHDDVIDALAMYQQLKRSRGSGSPGEPATEILTPLDALKAGRMNYKGTGISPLGALNASDLPDEVVDVLVDRWAKDRQEQRRSLRTAVPGRRK